MVLNPRLTTGPASLKSWIISFFQSTGSQYLMHFRHFSQQLHKVALWLSVGTWSASLWLFNPFRLTNVSPMSSIAKSEHWAGEISFVTQLYLNAFPSWLLRVHNNDFKSWTELSGGTACYAPPPSPAAVLTFTVRYVQYSDDSVKCIIRPNFCSFVKQLYLSQHSLS